MMQETPTDTPPASITLRAATLHEQVVLDAYREAIKGMLASADSAAEKVLTGAFSLATAYGALVALVKPETSAAPVVVGVPFLLFGLAALAGMWALSAGVAIESTDDVDAVRTAVATVNDTKRFRTAASVVVLAAAVVISGGVIVISYGT